MAEKGVFRTCFMGGFNKKDVFKKDAGKKDYSNKAGKPKTYSRDGKKSYKKNKSAE